MWFDGVMSWWKVRVRVGWMEIRGEAYWSVDESVDI